MNCALNEKGILIYAQNGQKEQKYYCPICSQEVILKESHKFKKFFSHIYACSSQIDQRRKVQESQMHLAGKEILYQQYQKSRYQASFEVFFKDIQQTADLFVKDLVNDNRIILEFQHTPISNREIMNRSRAYKKVCDQLLWFANYDYFKEYKKSSWAQRMIHYSLPQQMYYIPTIHINSKSVRFLGNLPLVYNRENLSIIEYQVNLNKMTVIDEKICQFKKREKRYNLYRIQQRIMKQAQYRSDIFALYQEGILLQNLPAWVFIENWEILMVKQPFWISVAWMIKILRNLTQEFSQENFLRELKNCSQIRWAESFVPTSQIINHTVKELWILFLEKHLIHEKSPGKFVYCYQY